MRNRPRHSFVSSALALVMVSAWLPSVHAAQATAPHHSNRSIGRTILLYLPNRLLDILDLVSLELGAGLNPHLNVHVTQAVQLGLGTGTNFSLIKDYSRQYGTGIVLEREFSIPFYTACQRSVRQPIGSVIPIEYSRIGVPSRDDEMFQSGAKDFWGIGFESWIFLFLGKAHAEIHPVELIDLVAGLVGFDPRHDDLH